MTMPLVTGIVAAVAAAEEESQNPLLPATYDIVWGGLSFVILFVLFWKYVLPSFNEIMARAHRDDRGRDRQGQADAGGGAADASTVPDASWTTAHDEAASIRENAEAEKVRRSSPRPGARRAGRRGGRSQCRRPRSRRSGRRPPPSSPQREVSGWRPSWPSKIVGESLDRRPGPGDRRPVHRRAGAGGSVLMPRPSRDVAERWSTRHVDQAFDDAGLAACRRRSAGDHRPADPARSRCSRPCPTRAGTGADDPRDPDARLSAGRSRRWGCRWPPPLVGTRWSSDPTWSRRSSAPAPRR